MWDSTCFEIYETLWMYVQCEMTLLRTSKHIKTDIYIFERNRLKKYLKELDNISSFIGNGVNSATQKLHFQLKNRTNIH